MKPSHILRTFLLAAGSSLLAISSASAQTTYTWDTTTAAGVVGGTGAWNTTNTLWTTDAGATNVSWVNAGAAPYNNATFGGTAGTVTLGEAINIRTLSLTDQTGSNRYTITGSTLNFSSGNITIAGTNGTNNVDVAFINSAITGSPTVTASGFASGNTQIVLAPGSGSQTLGKLGGIVIYRLAGTSTGNSFTGTASATSGDTKINVLSGASWTLTGVASGYEHSIAGTLFITGSGSLRSTHRDVALSSTGILHWNTASAIQDANISTARDRDFRIDGGSIDNSSGAAINSSTYNPQMRWNGNWTFIGSNGANSNLNMGTGDVFLTGNRQVTVTNAATTLTVGGVISNDTTTGRSLTKAGAGTLLLSGTGNNTYNGTTTVNGGVLALGKTAGVNAIAGAITLGDGATTAGNDILRLNADNQIVDTAVITFNAATGTNAGILRLNNRSETVAGIVSTGGGGIIENESGTAGTSTLTVNTTADRSFTGIIRNGDGSGTDGTLALTKTGANKLTLSGTNTYTGPTTISQGTLALGASGSIANSSTIIVGASTTFDVSAVSGFTLGSGQTLSGSGTVTGAMTVTGTLSPGNSPGILPTGSLIWSNGGNYNFQMLDATGLAGTGFDQIQVTGTLDLTGLTTNGFGINLWSLSSTGPDVSGNALNFNNAIDQSWIILATSGGISGFDAADFKVNVGANNGTSGFSNSLAVGGAFSVSLADSGTDIVLKYTVVPEPNVAALLGGLGVLMLLRRRR